MRRSLAELFATPNYQLIDHNAQRLVSYISLSDELVYVRRNQWNFGWKTEEIDVRFLSKHSQQAPVNSIRFKRSGWRYFYGWKSSKFGFQFLVLTHRRNSIFTGFELIMCAKLGGTCIFEVPDKIFLVTKFEIIWQKNILEIRIDIQNKSRLSRYKEKNNLLILIKISYLFQRLQ